MSTNQTDRMKEPEIIADWKFPIGSNVVRLIFWGTEITVEDIEACEEMLQLLKKQIIRRNPETKPA